MWSPVSLYVYDGAPFVAYNDLYGNVTVMEYSGSSWQPVGNPFAGGVVGSECLYIYDGIPYVVYIDNSGKATVMKYTGSSWEPVGSPGLSADVKYSGSLYVYDGIPFVACNHAANDWKATVMKYTDSSWEPVGNPGFSQSSAGSISLYVYDGTPYVAYSDGSPPFFTWEGEANWGKATVMKYAEYTPVIPAVAASEPNYCLTTGGTSVTITGNGFTGATGVMFGSTPASSFTVNSPTQITATSPAETAGTVDITVTTFAGRSATSPADEFTFFSVIPLPEVTAVEPNYGPTTGGTSVTITGNRFTGATGVMFGTTPATSFTVDSDTLITATSPPGTTGTVDITVTTLAGTSPTSPADEFTFTSGIPEFPSAALPVALIIGFLGAVILIHRTKEH